MSNMHNPAHPGDVLREYLPEGVMSASNWAV
jgi:plasmid maintenance system antidote protein VapI